MRGPFCCLLRDGPLASMPDRFPKDHTHTGAGTSCTHTDKQTHRTHTQTRARTYSSNPHLPHTPPTRRNQPEVCHWNCAQLANALLAAELVGLDEAQAVVGEYAEVGAQGVAETSLIAGSVFGLIFEATACVPVFEFC